MPLPLKTLSMPLGTAPESLYCWYDIILEPTPDLAKSGLSFLVKFIFLPGFIVDPAPST